jgi:hypothetical protein
VRLSGPDLQRRRCDLPEQPAQQRRVTIFSLTPVIEVGDSGVLTIERTDEPASATRRRCRRARSGNRNSTTSRRPRKPGGIYLASFGSRKALFKIDQLAIPGGPPLGRLVRL